MKQTFGALLSGKLLRRKFLYGCALTPAGFLRAQQTPPAPVPGRPQIVPVSVNEGDVKHWPVDDLRKVHATLAAASAAKGQMVPPLGDLVELPITHTHLFNFVGRFPVPNVAPRAEFHEGVSDIYFIVAGSGTITVGGELEGRVQVRDMSGEFQGSGVNGGRDYNVKAGDVLSIPPSTPHLTHPGPGGLTYMLLKVNIGIYPWNMVAMTQNAAQRAKVPLAPDQGGVVYWPGDDLKKAHATLVATAAEKNQIAPSSTGLVTLPVTRTHLFNFVCRYPVASPRPFAEFHEGCSDVYFIIGGSAALTIGGEVEGPRQNATMPGEFQGTGVKGGRTYNVKAGDILNIPPSTPHMTSPGPGGVSYMLVKVNAGLYPWSLIAKQQRNPA
jgi:mannose-6-phosphate isomerase-like protein (cupin superfamily)